MLFTRPSNEKGAAWPAILVGLFAAFGGILYGYDTGTISGIQTMPYWIEEFDNPNAGRIALIVSILSVGTFVGALAAGIMADITGRRWGIILSAMLPFNLGVALQTAATSQPLFIAGRFFAGLGVGLISAQSVLIGRSSFEFMANCSSPDTPRFLIKKGNDTQALRSLVFLRRLSADDPDLLAEMEELKNNWEYEKSIGSASYLECFKGTAGKRTITGIILQSLQQLVGINFIIYYGTSYFAENVQGLPDSFILQVIVNSINVVMTLPGLWAIDRFGRRPVLLTGALASTFGPCAWVVTGEIFSLQTRAKGLSMTTAANWFFNWLLSYITPYLTGALNPTQSNVFWIWGSFCWIAFVFTFTMIYETKGLSLEQVNELYESVSKAWRSANYRSELRRMSVSEAYRKESVDEETKPSEMACEDSSKV
ncbi:unnamed protein product [Aspergillus oryzae]|uniref:Unnamed protein product n=2 Tax=Aspergillus oryzae TaxID=5062 RepID=A0AAN5BTN6_ASPOZ|nr:unnamed protein product [Aspergillus oryzae]GMF91637.1 unnamed protein product [Aspergillus oryzae]GMG04792.1 unnamed protein product [Aspergillus oryzae]GMG32145.1 unnamed protein product [Aspergillus oryzae]GMG51075.1 unnamed protein product [Aspergillus oryzae var. brunneus]